MRATDLAGAVWRKSSRSTASSNCVEIAWRKSSFSTANSECVEIAWRKSSRSSASSNCVEIAVTGEAVAARDSKNPDGPVLAVGTAGWSAFVRTIVTR